MSPTLKNKCGNEHVFLVSLIFSSSTYNIQTLSTNELHSHGEEGELLKLGYHFIRMDYSPLYYRVKAPDVLLANPRTNIALVIDCKSGRVNNIEAIMDKFNEDTMRLIEDTLKSLYGPQRGFTIEKGLLVFDKDLEYYTNLVIEIYNKFNLDIFIWFVNYKPLHHSNTELYYIKKGLERYIHRDPELDNLLEDGFAVASHNITCQYLLDKEIQHYPGAFLQVFHYILGNSFKLRGQKISFDALARKIKTHYLSQTSERVIKSFIRDALDLLGVAKYDERNLTFIEFKKRPQLDYDFIDEIIKEMNNAQSIDKSAYRQIIDKLKNKKRARKTLKLK